MILFSTFPQAMILLQLVILECIFLCSAKRRPYFLLRGALCFLGSLLILYLYTQLAPLPSRMVLEIVSYFLAYFLAALFAWTVFELSPVSAIFISSCSYAMQHMAFCLERLIPGIGTITSSFPLVSSFSPLIPGLIFYFLVLRKNRHVYQTADRRQVLMSMLLLFVCIALNTIRYTNGADGNYLVIYDVLLCGCCLLIQFSISYSEIVREEKRTLELIINRQHDQHTLSQQAFDMLNIKIHNLRHQLNSMQQILEAADNEEVKSLLRTLQIYDTMADTGNATLDAVLMEKGLMCEINQIRFSFIADGKQLAFLEAADLFSLVNNILDNAIESEMKETDPERRILDLRIVRKNDMILLEAENYCRYPVNVQDNTVQTTKSDKENHGLGIRGIEYVVNKYNGEMTLSWQDELFRVAILIPVREKPDAPAA